MKGKATAPSWLRVQQAADLLAVSATTVRRWADSGKLACLRDPSGQRRFSRNDLERGMAARTRTGAGPAADDGTEWRYQMLFETSLELVRPSAPVATACRSSPTISRPVRRGVRDGVGSGGASAGGSGVGLSALDRFCDELTAIVQRRADNDAAAKWRPVIRPTAPGARAVPVRASEAARLRVLPGRLVGGHRGTVAIVLVGGAR